MSQHYMMVIAPAKKLAEHPKQPLIPTTQPRLLKETMQLVELLKQQSVADLKKLMHVSDAIAKLNVERYGQFSESTQKGKYASAALSTFKGYVFQKIDADNLTEAQWKMATATLRIISGLYGVLRPTDVIQPYRLDMGTPLENKSGKDLYAFWEARLATLIEKDMKEQGATTLINLASKEYFQSIGKYLSAPVVTIHFKEEVAGKLKVFGMNAKRARGLMVHYALVEGVNDVESLKQFNAEGYSFVPEHSTATDWLFAREKQ